MPLRLPAPFVDRPRLRARLDQAAPGALVLVSAAAGYGKSALVTDWLANVPRSRAQVWIGAHPDDDQRRFWARLIDGLGTVDAVLRVDDYLAALAASDGRVAGSVLGFLGALARRQPAATVVIDDYHDAHPGPDCCEPLQLLVDALPTSVQLVVITRGEPRLPLPRLRVQGRLHEIRADELAFSRDETGAFLAAQLGHRSLRQASITVLHERCEGWPAAIALAALAMSRHPNPDAYARAFAGDLQEVSDYLTSELLDPLDPADRQLLRDCAIVEELSGPLIEAITGRSDAPGRLRDLRRANRMILAVDDRGQWFRLHRLVRQQLLGELHTTQPQREAELHRRASDWYLQEGSIDHAINHAVRSNAPERAAELIVANWVRYVAHWQVGPVAGWLAQLPDATIEADRRLTYVAAAIALLEGDGPRFGEYLGQLNGGAPTDGEPPGDVLAAFAPFYGVDAMRAAAERAVATLATNPDRYWLWNARAAQARALYLAGEAGAALEALAEPMHELTLTRYPVLFVWTMGWAALISDACEEHEQAWRLLGRAREMLAAARLHHVARMGIVEVAEGRLLARRGDLAEGRAHLERGLQFAITTHDPLDQVVALLELVPVLAAMGDHVESRARLAGAADTLTQVPDAAWLHQSIATLRHRLRLRPGPRHHLPEPLSDRELSVLRLLGGSLSQPEIAAELGISPHTVKSHARAIYRKLGVSTRDEALAEARALEILRGAG
ncbi:MAG TPA: LuxR C-terminal-related transcriptional regulator [Candidatus Limnocylindria bacterium]|nr:LuxR C-terminal-related transcriptional regulator [Candidatus Limnocylindria bacterium]